MDADQIRDAVDRYVELFNAGDVAAWSALFAADAHQEDPVGTPPNDGRDAIAAFLANTRAQFGEVRLALKEPTVVTGPEAVATLQASIGSGEGRAKVPHIIDLFTFDDTGAITSLRAFWDTASVTPDPE